MTALYLLAALTLLGMIFLGGMLYMRTKRAKTETMKAVVWFCLCNGCAWVWCSYLLAYLGRAEIAESLSQVALTEIVAVVLAYAIKSAVENLSKHNNWPDKGGKDDTNA